MEQQSISLSPIIFFKFWILYKMPAYVSLLGLPEHTYQKLHVITGILPHTCRHRVGTNNYKIKGSKIPHLLLHIELSSHKPSTILNSSSSSKQKNSFLLHPQPIQPSIPYWQITAPPLVQQNFKHQPFKTGTINTIKAKHNSICKVIQQQHSSGIHLYPLSHYGHS